jgi:hypothetical protein
MVRAIADTPSPFTERGPGGVRSPIRYTNAPSGETCPAAGPCVPIAQTMLDPTRWLAWTGLLRGSVRSALGWASNHTGLPVVVVAAIALVASLHLFKRTLRFVIEVALAAALLLGATKLGLLSW